MLEASGAVGGRMRTEAHEGYLLDVGFQVYLTSYEEGVPYFDPCKLGFQSFVPGAYISNKQSLHFMGDAIRFPSCALSTLLCPEATLRDKWIIWRLSNHLKQLSDVAIWNQPDLSTLSYLRHLGLSDRVISCFFKPFFGGVFLDDTLSVSCRLFQFLYKRFATGSAALPREGMGAIPRALCKRLYPDVVRLHHRVTAIDNGLVRLEGGGSYRAKSIVCALDHHAAARLLPLVPPAPGRSTEVLYFATPTKPSRHPALVLNGAGSGCVNHFCFPSQIQPSYAPLGRHLASVTLRQGGDHHSQGTHPDKVLKEIRRWMDTDTSDWVFLKSFHVSNALPVLGTMPGPGFREVHPHLWQAGDYLAYPSINGALFSGRQVARLAMEAS